MCRKLLAGFGGGWAGVGASGHRDHGALASPTPISQVTAGPQEAHSSLPSGAED